MGDFLKAFKKILKYEGGYVNDKDDAGGETYKGVARKYNSDWDGWKIIDVLRKDKTFPNNLDDNQELQKQIQLLYKNKYWDIYWGDKIYPQDIVEEMFDISVNMGTKRAVLFLQQSLNLLNRNQKNYPDIAENGLFESKTYEILNVYLSKDKPLYLLKLLNVFQAIHYINYVKVKPEQEKYLRGWLKRVEDLKVVKKKLNKQNTLKKIFICLKEILNEFLCTINLYNNK